MTRTDRGGRQAVQMGFDISKLRDIALRDYVIRFAFGAGISLVAGLVTLTLGARIGGVFLAFPAILPAALTLVEKKEGTQRAENSAGGAILGAVALIAFAAVAYLLMTTSAVLALLLATVAWAAVAVLLYRLGCHLRPRARSDRP